MCYKNYTIRYFPFLLHNNYSLSIIRYVTIAIYKSRENIETSIPIIYYVINRNVLVFYQIVIF